MRPRRVALVRDRKVVDAFRGLQHLTIPQSLLLNMPKTVAYVIRTFPELSETFIAEEAASLLPLGVRPCIVYLQPGSRQTIHPVAQLLLERAKLYQIQTSKRIAMLVQLLRWFAIAPRRTLKTLVKALGHPDRWCYFQAMAPALWCRRQRVEFVHAHFADVNFQYACAMADWSGVPVGVTTHRYDIVDDPLPMTTSRTLLQRTDVLVTISEFNRRLMVSKFQLAADSIHIVHCGIDLQKFAFCERTFWVPGETLRLLNVGRLVREKGQDILLYALQRLAQLGISFRLDIIGAGSQHEQLRNLAQSLGLQEVVVFHGGQSEEVVRALHRQAHAFVLSSRSEGLPVACIEALALGTPTIASRINGIPELIEHRVSGLLVEVEDVIDLSETLADFYSQPARARAFAQAGRERVCQRFERQACTRELLGHWSAAVRRRESD